MWKARARKIQLWFRSLKTSQRWFPAIQSILGILALLFLLVHRPHSGVAVAFIAVTAAIISVHEGMQAQQKFTWMTIIGIFLVVELLAIRSDRQEDVESIHNILETESKGFRETAKNLANVVETSNQQFTQTSKNLQTSIEAATKAAEQTRPYACIALEDIRSTKQQIPTHQPDYLDFKHLHGVSLRSLEKWVW